MRAARSFVVLALTLFAASAGAELRTVDSLGVAGIRPGDAVDGARQNAVRYGVAEAVYRVVSEELPALDAEEARAVGRRLFSKKTRDYVTRFRVVEDRGTRTKQLTTLSGATHEYVVLVRAVVDVGPIRERLVRAGMLAPPGQGALRRVRLELETLPSYAAYEAIQETLVGQLKAQSALPIEFARGRVVLEVVTREHGERLLSRLAASPPPGLQLEPLEAGDRVARARVRGEPRRGR